MDIQNFLEELEGRGFDFQDKSYTEFGFNDEVLNMVYEMYCAGKEAQKVAVPETKQALNDRLLVKSIREHVESHINEISVNDIFDKGWIAAMKCIQNNIDMLEAQEQVG